MLHKSLVLVLLMLFIVPTFAQDELRQWVSSASATSEYSKTDWSAQQTIGEPDTKKCGDAKTAWASLTQDTIEELTVYFDTPVIPSELNIHQNYGRGSIAAVELIPQDGSSNIAMRGTADDGTDCPGVFTVNISDIQDPIIGVLIKVDQRSAKKWNEIDAVELVGTPTEDTSNPDTPSTTWSTAFGRSVTCDEGGQFDNGVEFTVIQMRVRSTYTVTAIGLNGFDPILAVLSDSGTGLCDDNSPDAVDYAAVLPSTGDVPSSGSSAQVVFTNRSTSGEAFRNVTFVVGGRDNQSGQFVLLLEGLTLSSADGLGDTISVHTNPAMISSGVPLTAYMMSVTQVFDPWIGLVDSEMNFLKDNNDVYFACDDAGFTSCWGESTNMESFAVSRSGGRALAGGSKDAMMTIPLDPSFEDSYINYLMSTIQGTYGDYIVVFHAGIGQP